MRVVSLILLAAMLAFPAVADDYKPVTCTSAKAYAGAPLRHYDLSSAFTPRTATAAAFDPALSAKLDAAFIQAKDKSRAVQMAAAVNLPGQGAWSASTAPEKLFYWASAGKTFTAIAILQLADEGRIKLSDPVSKWIPGVPNGDVITVEHLLTHTSGLFSANEDKVVQKSGKPLSLDDELKVVRKHGAMFCPGENWRYSNSGYALLGAILERVEHKPYAQVVTDRILTPLKLTGIRVVTPDDTLGDVTWPVSQGETPAIDMHVPGPAGGIVATPSAMIAVWSALLNGQLTGQTKDLFTTLYPMFGGPESYGQGVMVYDPELAGAKGEGQWLGHSGGAPGVKAIVAYSLKRKGLVAVALTGDGPAEAVAAMLLRQLD